MTVHAVEPIGPLKLSLLITFPGGIIGEELDKEGHTVLNIEGTRDRKTIISGQLTNQSTCLSGSPVAKNQHGKVCTFQKIVGLNGK